MYFIDEYETANVLTFFQPQEGIRSGDESVQVGDEAIIELSLYSKESGTVPAQFADKVTLCLLFIVF